MENKMYKKVKIGTFTIEDLRPEFKVQERNYEAKLSSSSKLGKAFTTYYRKKCLDPTKENFVVVLLNTQLQIIGFNLVSVGSLNGTIVVPREVFKPAIVNSASAIAVAHNHPSGEKIPSEGDKTLTKLLAKAGNILGIRLLDHFILSFAKDEDEDTFLSMADEAMIDNNE